MRPPREFIAQNTHTQSCRVKDKWRFVGKMLKLGCSPALTALYSVHCFERARIRYSRSSPGRELMLPEKAPVSPVPP